MRLIIAIIAISVCKVCVGHPGGLDSSGGHHDRRNGGYHLHRSTSAPEPEARVNPVPVDATKRTPRTASRISARSSYRAKDAREEISENYKPLPASPIALVSTPQPPVDPERDAQGKLRLAKQWIVKRRPEQAAKLLREVLQRFPDTDAAKEAEPLFLKVTGKAFEKDDSKLLNKDREAEAEAMLSKAIELVDNKETAGAIRYLTEVVLRYPDTTAANQAKQTYEKLTGHKFDEVTSRK